MRQIDCSDVRSVGIKREEITHDFEPGPFSTTTKLKSLLQLGRMCRSEDV
jgi:hypothetical protein